MAINGISEHMNVIASDGERIGTVDVLDATDRIRLARSGPASGGEAHLIPIEWVEYVDKEVHLSKSSKDVLKHWERAA